MVRVLVHHGHEIMVSPMSTHHLKSAQLPVRKSVRVHRVPVAPEMDFWFTFLKDMVSSFNRSSVQCTAQILTNKHVQTFLAFSHMVLYLGSVDIFRPCLFATHGNAQLGQKLVGLQKIASFIAHGLPWWKILKIPTINAFLAFLRPSDMKILSSKLDGYSSSWNLSAFVGFRMYFLWSLLGSISKVRKPETSCWSLRLA